MVNRREQSEVITQTTPETETLGFNHENAQVNSLETKNIPLAEDTANSNEEANKGEKFISEKARWG